MKDSFRGLFLILGMIILVILFRYFGVEKTIDHIMSLGWRFLIIVSIHIFSNFGLAYALRLFIHRKFTLREFITLVEARIAGDATSAINAIGAFAGEPIKAIYIKDMVPLSAGLAAVVIDRTVHSISVIFIFLTGIIIGLFVLDIPLYVSLLSLLWLFFLLFLLLILLKKQRAGFLSFVLSKLPGFLVKKFMTEQRWKSVEKLDKEISLLLLKENRKSFIISFFIHYFVILFINTLEIYLIMNFIEDAPQFNFLNAMFIYVLGFILTSVTFFMPANVGTSEGSFSLGLAMLGYDPVLGLSVGIIKRFRQFTWAAIGLPFLFYAGLIKIGRKSGGESGNDYN